ncbi:MAG: hypothetical protein JSR37_04490 [Verrucomicrobia bacterium]|nr:hypothetical protein [Verrucomicrobiota bacterium]MBS0636793.1 hypothetical protein [Verrucomicrobiota bacterium]
MKTTIMRCIALLLISATGVIAAKEKHDQVAADVICAKKKLLFPTGCVSSGGIPCHPNFLKFGESNRIVGTWSVVAARVGSINLRPAIFQFNVGNTMSITSGTILLPLGFDVRNNFFGDWCLVEDDSATETTMQRLSELLFTDGYVTGRFDLVIQFALTKNCNPLHDSLDGSYVFRVVKFKFAENPDGTGSCLTTNNPANPICGEEVVVEGLDPSVNSISGTRLEKTPFFEDPQVANAFACKKSKCCEKRKK